MSVSILKQNCYTIAFNAFKATFCGETDSRNIADKFAKSWSADFSLAVQTYISQCLGIYPGGPVIAAPISTLEMDIFNAGRKAYIETFCGESDARDIATKFGNGLKPIATSIGTYMSTCMTIPGFFPLFMSSGGPLIALASSSCVPVCMSSGKQAYIETFCGESDSKQISTLFAMIFQQTGLEIGTYAATAISAPAGVSITAS